MTDFLYSKRLSEMAYRLGDFPPNFPVPVFCDMTGNDGRKYAVVRWMDNMDSFWTDQHGGRGISR